MDAGSFRVPGDGSGCSAAPEPEMIVVENDIIAPTEDTAESDESDEIILCVLGKNTKIGAAYFNLKSSELFLLNDIGDAAPEHNMLKNLYRQIQPAIVMSDGRSPKSLVACLKSLVADYTTAPHARPADGELDDKSASGLHLFQAKEYNYDSCKSRLCELKPPDPDADRELYLNSIVDFGCALTVHAAGALLKYLDKNWCFLNVDACANPTVLAINVISLYEKIVTINDESYKALQIFNKLSHPSNFKKGTAQSSKEGLSLFGVFNKCRSKMGMQHLRLILQQPTNDLKVIQRRLDTIAFCNKPGNEELIRRICSSLRHIRNVNGIMTRLKGLRANPLEWKLLFNTLYNAVLICEICETVKDSSSLINALGSRNNDNLFQVAHHMNRVIDFELTAVQGKFTVKFGVDPELDKKKQVMAGLHELMSTTAKYELEKLPEFIKECTMVYLPNLGYLLGVKMWKEKLNQEEKILPNLKFMFQNENCIYYKSQGCNELDYRIGDTYPEILAHEMRIMMRLTKFILKHLHPLSSVVQLCAELDSIVSVARACKENDYTRPTLTFDKIIDIEQGRHPLQELCVERYVPNDTRSGGDSPRDRLVTVLAGPNACGKSIYLKQVALIVYMAHVGSYVPAAAATIGLVDAIHTRVQTVEDVAARMSAFMIDLRQISNALNASTSRSLVVVDEFGKGTTEVDGLALLAACLNGFLFRDANCPHLFVATHFHSLGGYLMRSPRLGFMSMEYTMRNDKIVFLYKLADKLVQKSFAHEVAENTGIERHICERAKKILDKLDECYPSLDESYKNNKRRESIIEGMKKLLKRKRPLTERDILTTFNI